MLCYPSVAHLWLGAAFLAAPALVSSSDVSGEVLGSFRTFLPAAFGDYNGDKQTDLFVMDPDRHALEVVLVFHAQTPMLHRRKLRCEYSDLTIHSLVPSDFDGDGAMDVLVMARAETDGNPHHLRAFVLWGTTQKIDCRYNSTIEMLGQPLALDYDGDMVTDLFGQSRNGSRTFWVFGRDRSVRTVTVDPLKAPAPLRLPHASVFADVTGDLSADLVVASDRGYEIWEHGQNDWTLSRDVVLPAGAVLVGQSIIFDIDSDGTVEHLVPVCFDDKCLNSSLLVERNGSWSRVLLETDDAVHGQWGFVQPSEAIYSDTITARVGDYNLDGYPDLLMTLTRKDGVVATPRSFLLRNTACPPAAGCALSRSFQTEWATFAEYPDSPAAAFYDLGDDGLLDAFVVHVVDGVYTVSVDRNSADYDALFLKVIVLDGGCYNNCSYGIHIPYGTNKPGPAMRARMTLIDGSIWSFAAVQLSRSGHHALQLPYTVLGLGRSPNFVDNLNIGVPRVSQRWGPLTQQWTQLIPNSQMIVVPHPPAVPSRWINKLYVTPGQTIMATLIALLGTLALTMLVIGLLHWRERRQDRRERLQEAHRFNFDAM